MPSQVQGDANTPRPSLYVGVDFGTHQSGFSTAVLGGSVRFMEIYPQQPVPYCKTLTMLLYAKQSSEDWRPVSWGWAAFQAYQKVEPDRQSDYVLLDR